MNKSVNDPCSDNDGDRIEILALHNPFETWREACNRSAAYIEMTSTAITAGVPMEAMMISSILDSVMSAFLPSHRTVMNSARGYQDPGKKDD